VRLSTFSVRTAPAWSRGLNCGFVLVPATLSRPSACADGTTVQAVDAGRFRHPQGLRVPKDDIGDRGRAASVPGGRVSVIDDDGEEQQQLDDEGAGSVSFKETLSPTPRRLYGFGSMSKGSATPPPSSPQLSAAADLREVRGKGLCLCWHA
jgi:hypothetical protein